MRRVVSCQHADIAACSSRRSLRCVPRSRPPADRFPFTVSCCRQRIVSRWWCRVAAAEPSPEGEAERRPRGALVGRGAVARGWAGGGGGGGGGHAARSSGGGLWRGAGQVGAGDQLAVLVADVQVVGAGGDREV